MTRQEGLIRREQALDKSIDFILDEKGERKLIVKPTAIILAAAVITVFTVIMVQISV